MYNCLRYQQYKAATSAPRLVVELTDYNISSHWFSKSGWAKENLYCLKLWASWGAVTLLDIIIYRPEEALDIQSELIFINGMVYLDLPQEWNFGIPATLPSPATLLSPLTATPKAIFSLTWRHTFNILHIKSLCVLSTLPCFRLILCAKCASIKQVKAWLAIHDWQTDVWLLLWGLRSHKTLNSTSSKSAAQNPDLVAK